MREGLRYAVLAALAMIGLGLSETLLLSRTSLYMAYEPAAFLAQWQVLLGWSTAMALLGSWAERESAPRWAAPLARSLLLAALLLAAAQVLRRSLLTGVALGGLAKLALPLLALGLASWVAWRRPPVAAGRLASALGVGLLTAFLLQPGMPSYLLELGTAGPGALPPAAPTAHQAPARRVVVVVFDEWDQELSERAGLFQRPLMQGLAKQALVATQAQPAGPNTMQSVPGMVAGRPFEPMEALGPGRLRDTQGRQVDAGMPGLFNDAAERGWRLGVAGFYHDYCRLAPHARDCLGVPVQAFPGWGSVLMRPLRGTQDFDHVFSDFLRQWNGTWQRLRAAALRQAANPALDLVWLHLNIPHPPALAGPPQTLGDDYRANLRLLEGFLADLQLALASDARPSTLILLSDHPLREASMWRAIYERQRGPGSGSAGKTTGDTRVPLIVWFSDASDGVQESRPVQTLKLRPLVQALLENRVRHPAEAAALLQR